MKEIIAKHGERILISDDDYDLRTFGWYTSANGYAVRVITGGIIYMHRTIGERMRGTVLGKLEMDHINHNKLDNRRPNLRTVTRSQNNMNMRKPRNSYSRFKGVSWHSRHHYWQAYITKDQKTIHLGTFKDEMQAALAYDIAAKELYGEFANLNFD